jgi:hypothetical protein
MTITARRTFSELSVLSGLYRAPARWGLALADGDDEANLPRRDPGHEAKRGADDVLPDFIADSFALDELLPSIEHRSRSRS